MPDHDLKLQPNGVEKVLETPWFTLEAVSYPSLDSRPYYRISANDSVAVMALTTDKKIILVRQFRPAIGLVTLELPAGDICGSEAPEGAARRELREEAGYDCENLKFVGFCRVAPDRINSRSYVFFGRDARPIQEKSLEAEDIDPVLVTEEEFRQMIAREDFAVVSGIAIYTILKLRGYF